MEASARARVEELACALWGDDVGVRAKGAGGHVQERMWRVRPAPAAAHETVDHVETISTSRVHASEGSDEQHVPCVV